MDTGSRKQNAEKALARILCEQDRDAVVNLIVETEKRLQTLDGPRSSLWSDGLEIGAARRNPLIGRRNRPPVPQFCFS